MATEIATMQSHRKLLKHALAKGYERVFVLEDDIDFADNFKHLLSLAMAELPTDWDGLHLGGYSTTNTLTSYSPLLNRCLRSCGGYGYIVNAHAIPKILEVTKSTRHQFDIHLANMMPNMRWFKTKEMLVKHLAGYSDIQGRFVDYKNLY